jgi:hypothetical protein
VRGGLGGAILRRSGLITKRRLRQRPSYLVFYGNGWRLTGRLYTLHHKRLSNSVPRAAACYTVIATYAKTNTAKAALHSAPRRNQLLSLKTLPDYHIVSDDLPLLSDRRKIFLMFLCQSQRHEINPHEDS